eukprot:m.32080 g.32080  ORF g.32080 m.32080 type:complete len:81 (-) comp6360_c0_seq1:53-295(-)
MRAYATRVNVEDLQGPPLLPQHRVHMHDPRQHTADPIADPTAPITFPIFSIQEQENKHPTTVSTNQQRRTNQLNEAPTTK